MRTKTNRMPKISSVLIEMTPDLERWLEDEYRATLAYHRKKLCGATDRLEIRIPRILCESCFGASLDDIFAPIVGLTFSQIAGSPIWLTFWTKTSRAHSLTTRIPPDVNYAAAICTARVAGRKSNRRPAGSGSNSGNPSSTSW